MWESAGVNKAVALFEGMPFVIGVNLIGHLTDARKACNHSAVMP